MEPFDSRTIEVVRRLKPKKALDFGSGEAARFAKMLCQEFTDLHVYCVDALPVKETPNISYLSHQLFMEESAPGLERLKGRIDLAHSCIVFHEVCHDYTHGEKLGGIKTPEATRILANLFSCLRQGGNFVVTDFVACDLYDFLNRSTYRFLSLEKTEVRQIMASEKHKRMIDTIYDTCIAKDATPEVVDSIVERSQIEFGQDPEEIRNLMMRYYVDYERLPAPVLSAAAVENPFIHLMMVLRKYRDHHTRCSINDYREAVAHAGFKVVEEWTPDKMSYQLICRK